MASADAAESEGSLHADVLCAVSADACIVDSGSYTPAGTAYTQAHAVHAPAARALLHAARVQCVRVKKNKRSWPVFCLRSLHDVRLRLEGIQSPLPRVSGP